MADRLHNLRTIGAQPKHKQLKIAAETEYIYAIGTSFGFVQYKDKFQDICLKITDPEMFDEISHKLSDSDQTSLYIAEFIKPLKRRVATFGCTI